MPSAPSPTLTPTCTIGGQPSQHGILMDHLTVCPVAFFSHTHHFSTSYTAPIPSLATPCLFGLIPSNFLMPSWHGLPADILPVLACPLLPPPANTHTVVASLLLSKTTAWLHSPVASASLCTKGGDARLTLRHPCAAAQALGSLGELPTSRATFLSSSLGVGSWKEEREGRY